jgi:hypothetical protein
METLKMKSLKEIANEIRKSLKAEFPQCKFSVKTAYFAGGQSLTVALMAAPFQVFVEGAKLHGNSYAQLNQYYLKDDSRLTEEAKEVLVRVLEISQKHNWDRSDTMTDYFDVNYYLNLHVGKWDKPFEVIESKQDEIATVDASVMVSGRAV